MRHLTDKDRQEWRELRLRLRQAQEEVNRYLSPEPLAPGQPPKGLDLDGLKEVLRKRWEAQEALDRFRRERGLPIPHKGMWKGIRFEEEDFQEARRSLFPNFGSNGSAFWYSSHYERTRR